MEPKPRGWGPPYGGVFQEPSVAAVYHLRPPYPEDTFAFLAGLARGGAVLDAGCGTGDLARPLARRVARVDAVDVSSPMIDCGRNLSGGAATNVRWIVGAVEDAPLDPPYSLITAGESVHWFDWAVALPRLAGALAPGGALAIVHRGDWFPDEAVRERLRPIFARHSWNVDFEPRDPVDELERRGLFERLGTWTSRREPWRPTLEEAVETHFSTSGLARPRLRDPNKFAAEVHDVLAELEAGPDGRLELDVAATVVWGRPPAAAPWQACSAEAGSSRRSHSA